MKFAKQTHTRHYPPQLRHVATLRWEIDNSNFLHTFSKYGKHQISYILRNYPPLNFVCRPLCCVAYPFKYKRFYQNRVFVAEYYVNCSLQ